MVTGGATRKLVGAISDAFVGGLVTAQWYVRYPLAIALFLIGLMLRFSIASLAAGYPFLTFFPAVTLAAMVCGPRPAILAAALSAIAADYLFIPPFHSFAVGPGGILPLLCFCLAAALVCLLAHLQQSAASKARAIDERYRSVLEDQSETICRYLPDGTLLYVNRAFCRLAGLSERELVGRPWHPIPLPEDIEHIERALARLSPSHPTVLIENRIRTANNQVRWMQFINRGLYDESGKLLELQSVGRDITDRMRTEAMLRDSESRYRSVVAAMAEGMLFHDARGTVTATNAAAERILGRTRDEIIGRTSGRPIWPIIGPDGQPLTDDAHPSMVTLRTGTAQKDVIMGICKPAGITWIAINSEPVFEGDTTSRNKGPVAVVATFHDITKQRDIEHRLAGSAQEIEELYDNAPCGYHSLGPDATILRINATELKWLGLGRDAVVGKMKFTDFLTPDGKARFRRVFPVLQRKDSVTGIEAELVGFGGERRFVSISANAIRDAAGKLVCTRSVVYDITEKRRLENAIVNAERRVKERLGHDLHDGLGQELTGIAMLTAAAAKIEQKTGGPVVEALAQLEQLTRDAVATCRDIAHGLSPFRYAKGNLIDAIDHMVKSQRTLFGTNIRFEKIQDAPLVLPQSAQDHLFRIAQEAVSNARQHAKAQQIAVTLDVQPDIVRLDIQDDGVGLPDPALESTGIGLAVIGHRAEAIDANFSIGAAPGGGTLVRCECPQTPTPP